MSCSFGSRVRVRRIDCGRAADGRRSSCNIRGRVPGRPATADLIVRRVTLRDGRVALLAHGGQLRGRRTYAAGAASAVGGAGGRSGGASAGAAAEDEDAGGTAVASGAAVGAATGVAAGGVAVDVAAVDVVLAALLRAMLHEPSVPAPSGDLEQNGTAR